MIKIDALKIFTECEEVKFTSYWSRVEKYINIVSFNKNIRELLAEAISEETTKLVWTLHYIIPIDDARGLVHGIRDVAIELAVERTDIEDDNLRDFLSGTLEEALEPLSEYNDIKLVKGLMEYYIDTFMRCKIGADVFGDLVFSNSIITENLENDAKIEDLFYFISSLSYKLNLEGLRKQVEQEIAKSKQE